jgi:hypothetical protein
LIFGLRLASTSSITRKTSATVVDHSPLQTAFSAFPIANAETPKSFRMLIVGQQGVEKGKREFPQVYDKASLDIDGECKIIRIKGLGSSQRRVRR